MIKSVRLAIEQSKLNVTPRQEGAVLYISLPRITRERRENLANNASKKLLNEYKKALNEVISNFLPFKTFHVFVKFKTQSIFSIFQDCTKLPLCYRLISICL